MSHLKYASDEDLKQVGLSKPEIRRLRKFYEKYYPHGYLSKIKRLLHNPVTKKDEMAVNFSLCFATDKHTYKWYQTKQLFIFTGVEYGILNGNTENDQFPEQIVKQ